MTERADKTFARLSSASTELLIQRAISPADVDRVEQELQAYFSFDPKIFGGVLYHRDGRGPEKPYFKPEDSDSNPIIQAIAKIGVQYHYWEILYSALKQQIIDPVRMKYMDILVLHMNADGGSLVEIRSQFLQVVVKEKGDETSRYPGYALMINYAGDANFYGSEKNYIFPMNLKMASGETCLVERTDLGVSVETADNVWNSWDRLGKTNQALYSQAVSTYRELLPQYADAADVLERNILRGEPMGQEFAVLRAMLRYGLDDEVFNQVREIIGKKAREIMTGNVVLLSAAKTHADNLHSMYETAKGHCQDIYHYR